MPFNTINNVYKNVKQVDEDLSQGHVSVQETSKAVNDIKKTWFQQLLVLFPGRHIRHQSQYILFFYLGKIQPTPI